MNNEANQDNLADSVVKKNADESTSAPKRATAEINDNSHTECANGVCTIGWSPKAAL